MASIRTFGSMGSTRQSFSSSTTSIRPLDITSKPTFPDAGHDDFANSVEKIASSSRSNRYNNNNSRRGHDASYRTTSSSNEYKYNPTASPLGSVPRYPLHSNVPSTKNHHVNDPKMHEVNSEWSEREGRSPEKYCHRGISFDSNERTQLPMHSYRSSNARSHNGYETVAERSVKSDFPIDSYANRNESANRSIKSDYAIHHHSSRNAARRHHGEIQNPSISFDEYIRRKNNTNQHMIHKNNNRQYPNPITHHENVESRSQGNRSMTNPLNRKEDLNPHHSCSNDKLQHTNESICGSYYTRQNGSCNMNSCHQNPPLNPLHSYDSNHTMQHRQHESICDTNHKRQPHISNSHSMPFQSRPTTTVQDIPNSLYHQERRKYPPNYVHNNSSIHSEPPPYTSRIPSTSFDDFSTIHSEDFSECHYGNNFQQGNTFIVSKEDNDNFSNKYNCTTKHQPRDSYRLPPERSDNPSNHSFMRCKNRSSNDTIYEQSAVEDSYGGECNRRNTNPSQYQNHKSSNHNNSVHKGMAINLNNTNSSSFSTIDMSVPPGAIRSRDTDTTMACTASTSNSDYSDNSQNITKCRCENCMNHYPYKSTENEMNGLCQRSRMTNANHRDTDNSNNTNYDDDIHHHRHGSFGSHSFLKTPLHSNTTADFSNTNDIESRVPVLPTKPPRERLQILEEIGIAMEMKNHAKLTNDNEEYIFWMSKIKTLNNELEKMRVGDSRSGEDKSLHLMTDRLSLNETQPNKETSRQPYLTSETIKVMDTVEDNNKPKSILKNHGEKNDDSAPTRTIWIKAPMDLEAGFKFTANVKGEVIEATVPHGGVRKGAIFPAIIPESSSNKSEKESTSKPWKKIKVRAPTDLKQGYCFTVKVKGEPVTANVPTGGVKKGEVFTVFITD